MNGKKARHFRRVAEGSGYPVKKIYKLLKRQYTRNRAKYNG